MWRFPRWGTALGVLFWLLMLGGLGGVVGFFLLFGMMMGTLPFLLIAGGELGPKIGVGVEVLVVVFVLGRQTWAAFRSDTQKARDRALNWLVLGILIVSGLALSVAILVREWPH